MIKQGEKYIVTSDNWFLAPDGQEYRAAYGVCHLLKMEDVFGFTPQRPSTNWFMQVGEGDNMVMIAGCQIHYVVKCDKKPSAIEGVHNIPNTQTDQTVKNKIFFTE